MAVSISYVKAGLDPLASNPPWTSGQVTSWVTAATFTSGVSWSSAATFTFTGRLHTGQPPGLRDAASVLRTLLHEWGRQRATLRLQKFSGDVYHVRNYSTGPMAAIFRVVKA